MEFWNLPSQLKYTLLQCCYNTIVLLFRFTRSIGSYRNQTVRIGMHSSNLNMKYRTFRGITYRQLILRPEIKWSYARDAALPLAIGHSKSVWRICTIES